MTTRAILTEYITKELSKGRGGTIKPDDDLLGAGIIDSLGILQLVAFVEQQFSIQIPDEDVVLENFQSVAALSDYLDNHRPA